MFLYREYKGYTIRKNCVMDTYEIRKNYKYLYQKCCHDNWYSTMVIFPRLKDAKKFIDRLVNNEISLDHYEWKSRSI